MIPRPNASPKAMALPDEAVPLRGTALGRGMIPRPESACRWQARPRHHEPEDLMTMQRQAAADTVAGEGLKTLEGHRVAQGVG